MDDGAGRAGGARSAMTMFTVGSLVAIIAITALAGLGVYEIYYHHIIGHSEINAVNLAEAIFEQERAALTGGRPTGGRIEVKPEAVAALDDRMRKYLKPLEIVKIKVFSADGRIVYSTDHSIIGQVDRENARLANALAGKVDSQLKTKDRLWDLAGEEKIDLDLVETYIPVRDGARTIGAFETYTDLTWSRKEIATVLKLTTGVVAGVLVLVFALLFVVMRVATSRAARAERALEEMAVIDSLTGLANRRQVMTRAVEECARIPRHRDKGAVRAEVGFVMADIDLFKKVNDTHGHLVGDEILHAVAERIRRSTRRYDIVGRYGGEEFLVVAPHTDEHETRAVAERLWEMVRAEPIATTAGPVAVTISVGYTCAANDDVNAAIKRADEALYRAKNAGRDRVVPFE